MSGYVSTLWVAVQVKKRAFTLPVQHWLSLPSSAEGSHITSVRARAGGWAAGVIPACIWRNGSIQPNLSAFAEPCSQAIDLNRHQLMRSFKWNTKRRTLLVHVALLVNTAQLFQSKSNSVSALKGGDTQTARLFRCIMLWNWVTTRPRFSDRKNKTLLYSLAALTTEACCDRREAAAQGAERGGFCLFVCFIFWCRGVFLPLESDALDWAAASNKHRCLKTCRCFTLCKKECGSSNHIVYGIRLRILFCFLKYLYIFLSAVYVI